MQIDPDQQTIATADTVEHAMGDIGMTPLSKALRVGRFSLDVRHAHELEISCRLSANTIV